MSDATQLTEILDEIDNTADGESVSVGEIMSSLGHRGSGVFILVPALIGASPVGMIPTVPTIVAAIVFLFAVQIALGRDSMWLPEFLKSREVEAEKLDGAIDKIRPWAKRLDGWFGERLTALTGAAGTRAAAVAVMVIALAIPPLEVVPGAALLPLLSIAAIGLALAVRDGVVMLLAWILAAVAALTAWGVV